jgi:hypothetical protein
VQESTSIVYDAKWTIFSDWCVGREIDPFKISVQQLADFLVFLFEVKGLAPSTVKGYRSAISRSIDISGGEDFGNNQFISLLVRNFSLERPRHRVLVPQWNLGLVLSALNLTPFEPAEEVDLKFLSYKCCFLLALASCRRRSEVHAFSTSNSCLRFSGDKSSVTLLTDPAFLGKNQIADKGTDIMSFDLEFVKYNLTRRFVCKRNSLAYPGRNGFNREIRDTLLNKNPKFLE